VTREVISNAAAPQWQRLGGASVRIWVAAHSLSPDYLIKSATKSWPKRQPTCAGHALYVDGNAIDATMELVVTSSLLAPG